MRRPRCGRPRSTSAEDAAPRTAIHRARSGSCSSRRCLDRRPWRSRCHVPGRLAADARMALAEHHNIADAPMVWLDGLDIPWCPGSTRDLRVWSGGDQRLSDPAGLTERAVVGHPGFGRSLPPQDFAAHGLSVEHTDAALSAQLDPTPKAAACSRPGPRRSEVHEPDERRRRVVTIGWRCIGSRPVLLATPAAGGLVGVAGVRGHRRDRARRGRA